MEHSLFPVLVLLGDCDVPEHVPELLHLRRQLADLVLLQHRHGHQLVRRHHVAEATAGYLQNQICTISVKK